MHSSVLSIWVSSAFAHAARAAVISQQSPTDLTGSLTVDTTAGSVTGFINETAPDVRQWLGVPYAEPPVGALRFLPPQPKTAFGNLTTTAYQPSCMQQLSNSSTPYTDVVPEFLINGGQSEDCLYVNVYAPLHPVEEKLPVFIYIPGGGFTGGGADSLYKIPDQWIQRTQGHIFVIMNYRVNIFGFPNAGAASQNAGLLDQRLVVEWARDNIAAFGGDPSKITLWGQSAGGTSVGMYGYAWYEDPIVSGLIADSGAASILTVNDPEHATFTKFAGFVGCANLTAEEELECMQNVDAETIQNTLSFGGTGTAFRPVADDVTAFTNISQRLVDGKFADVPYITGSNSNEGASLGSTYDPNGMVPGQYENGLRSINCPVSQEVANREAAGLTTYYYEYAGNFSNISPLPWLGAMHSAELPLVFGTHFQYRGNSTEFEWEVASAMQELWLSFAVNPSQDPATADGFVWPKYTAEVDSMVLFAAEDEVSQLQSSSILAEQCSALSTE
ncbi:carboxylesterase [Colletotrichum karsti]|uniref:Carboxylic ester hydrolase n=1 Tax=Colletotrichum karsti TaxID=1095194 RepID=A0A9P6I0H9_9PEZI|nr:carboxylesterase [Colletotrichum karsti]KAF9869635.1 carboxylesterase [Colletotrichum karsti]